MNKLNTIKVELLELVISDYLWNGHGEPYYNSTKVHLCMALVEAAGMLDEKYHLTYVVAALDSIRDDISIAIGGKTYASQYLRDTCGWALDTPRTEFQQWRRELAERLIAKYKGEEA